MALSLDDIEQEVEEQKPAAKAKPAASSAPANSVAPPAAEDTSFSGMLNKARQQGPAVINEAWKGVAPYLNPMHYQEGGPQDYTNIDWPTTVAHGVGEAALGYGLAKRGSRVISGEAGAERAAQKEYREQNKLAREKFEYQKKMDAEAKRAAQPPLRAAPTPVTPPPPTPVQVAQQAGPVVARPADVAAVSNPDASGNTLAIEERRIARQNQATQDLYRAAQPNFQSPKLTTPPASVAGAPAPAAPVPAPQPAAPSPVAQAAAQTAPAVAPTVSQLAQEAAPAVSAAAQAPASAVAPAEKNKGGFPKGATRLPANIKDTPETWQKFTKEGLTFLPGYGPGDNNLYNTYGAEGRRAILEKYNEGKPIGTYENYLKLNEKLKKGVPASEVPALMSRLPSEDEAGNYSKLGKAAKVAGVGGLLISAANLANAKTPGERSLAGANLLGAVIPPAANINEAGAPVLPPNILAAQQRQLEEMQKLGSPYRKR